MKYYISLFLLFLLPAAGWAQSLPGTDYERLRFLSDSFAQVSATQKAEAIAWARANNRPVRAITPDGTEVEIMRIENGNPVYYATGNDDAALSTNTNDLWNGGSLGLNLEGQGMTIGEWDGGSVRATHQEFNAGAGSRVTQGDSPSSSSWHATHVAGTLMAEGDVPSAQGMAPQADLHAYDWNSDNSEMSTEAAGGLLVSNHSYGTICGWYNDGSDWYWYGDPAVSSTEDHNFGRYNSDARAWDLIAEAAPYYLICKSAGNDRNDDHNGSHFVWSGGSWTSSSASRDPDGGSDGYDCVGPAGTAKNVLTVAAVSDVTPGYSAPSDVSMSSFSGWGPTDDGRIKPDISGNGISLYSCDDDNDSDYTTSSGTSMSSPNVAGSLILLQQHYNNLNGSYMRSSTLKALVIHTANEVGSNNGPDYEFGWGLLDAAAAAQAISNTADNSILEPTLSNGSTWSMTFTSDGSTPFSATIAWIDPAASASGSVLNPTTSRLTNDLDIRISDGGAGVWFPWRLDPSNPSNAATTGDNFRDNVEKIEPGVLPAGTYTVFVTHKGTLASSQPFSIVLTGVPSVPVADFTASSTQVCVGETITLNNASSGSPTSYTWSITPPTGWSYVNGTNSTSTSPQIQISSSVTLSITLTATNSLGSDTETKSNYIGVGGLSIPFTEDFESSGTQDLWTIENPDGSNTWTFQSVGGNGGSTAAGIDNFGYSAANTAVVQDHLISPTLDFTGMNSIQFTFEYAYRRYSNSYRDSLSIWISSDCGVTWTRLASYDENGSGNFATGSDVTSQFTPSSAADWCDGSGSPSCPTFDLSAYSGMSGIQIRFTNLSGWGNDMFIDNINVSGSSASPLTLSVGGNSESCPGENDGTAFTSPSGGTPTYTYLWSNGAVTSSLSGLSPGTYSVTVTDAVGATATGSHTVGSPTPITLSSNITNPTSAHSNDGSISITVSGFTGFYTYTWSNGSSGASSNASLSLSNLDEGSYAVTVSYGGCSATSSYSLMAPFDVSIGGNDETCPGENDGIVFTSPSGGSPGYTYIWSTGATTSSINGLAPGTYSVTVTDAAANTLVRSHTVDPATPITLAFNGTNPITAHSNDGSISITVGGFTGFYFYAWSNGSTGATSNATISLTNLDEGTYGLTVTASGCSVSQSYALVAPFNVSIGGTDESCPGENDGVVFTSPSGGYPTYTFLWSTGAITQSLVGVSAGAYSVTVTDNVGNTIVESYTITAPTALTVGSSSIDPATPTSNDGSISLSAAGGTGQYTFTWSTGYVAGPTAFGNQTLGTLDEGAYSVTITSGGCKEIRSFTLSAPISVSTFASHSNVCPGDATGSILVSPSGGVSPYAFLWADGTTTQSRNNLPFGNYSLTVTDQNGAVYSESFSIGGVSNWQITGNVQNENGFGAADGSISHTVSGGTSPYSYSWSNGDNTKDVFGLAAGSYSVTITDNLGCATERSYTVSLMAMPLTVISQIIDPLCSVSFDGQLLLTVSGGVPPYSYVWSDGATTEDRTSFLFGLQYSVTVTDQVGQTDTESFTFTVPSPLSTTPTITHETVSGFNDGAISISPSGGTPGYNYQWSHGPQTSSVNGLSPGDYSVTVTDANGCITAQSITITAGIAPTTVSGSVTNIFCHADNTGAIDITPSNGQPPYTYQWSNGAVTQDIGSLIAGNYTVTVTGQLGSTAIGQFTVTEPVPLNGGLQAFSDASIFGATDGTATLTASGGTPSYTYSWSDGGAGSTRTDLAAGNYTVTISDQCSSVSVVVVIDEPDDLVISLSSLTHVLCSGDNTGALTINITGGTTPYTIIWSTGSQTTSTTGLTAGPYSVTVVDNAGDQATGSWSVNEPSPLSVSASSTNETLAGAGDGTVTANVSGGTPPYQYLWNTGGQSTSLSGLVPGNYTVTITDDNGCLEYASTTVSTGVSTLTASLTSQDIDCHGAQNGSINVVVSGGQMPYFFQWTDGATSEDRSGLSAGIYGVTISDNSGQTASLSVTVSEPNTLALSVSTTNESISGYADGSTSANPSGGTPPYQYLWSTGQHSTSLSGLAPGTYGVTVTDANGCIISSSGTVGTGFAPLAGSLITTDVSCAGQSDGSINVSPTGGLTPYSFVWSDGATTEDRSGLSAGSYSVTVSDALGQAVNLSALITEPMPLMVFTTSIDETVAGFGDGSATVSASGGTPNYSYLWSTGETSMGISQLASGSYSVTVTDAQGCSLIGSLSITAGIPILTVTATSTNVVCSGGSTGSIDLTASGGALPYQFLWNDGTTTEDRSGLGAGIYDVTVSDGSGQSASASVIITEPLPLAINMTLMPESVAGASDGSASATVLGGTPPYYYLWNTGATTPMIGGLSPGTYTVTVTDNNGCATQGTGGVGAGAPILTATGNAMNVTCFGGNSGSIDISISGGQAPITTFWNDGIQSEDRSGLQAGIYSVSISDAVGQSVVLGFTITQPTQLLLSLSQTDETQAGLSDGTASSTVSGGTPPYTFAWTNGETAGSVANLAAGQYSLTVTDFNGCSASGTVTIAAGPPPLTTNVSMTEIECYGEPGSATVSASGGMAPYTYLWSTGATTSMTLAPLVAQYNVTVTDAQGWTTQDSVIVTGVQFPTQVIVDLTDSCNSTISLIVIGGAAPYQFDWIDLNDPTNNPTGPTITLQNACADAVCLSAACVITDANGCVFETDTVEFTGCLSNLEEFVIDTKIYPNPGTRSLTIESSHMLQNLIITNAWGAVMSELGTVEKGALQIETNEWPNGTYFLRANIEGRSWTYRWIKTD